MKKTQDVRVLCCVWHEFFNTPRSCLDCSNWNVCLECLRKESEETTRILAERGITLPPIMTQGSNVKVQTN